MSLGQVRHTIVVSRYQNHFLDFRPMYLPVAVVVAFVVGVTYGDLVHCK